MEDILFKHDIVYKKDVMIDTDEGSIKFDYILPGVIVKYKVDILNWSDKQKKNTIRQLNFYIDLIKDMDDKPKIVLLINKYVKFTVIESMLDESIILTSSIDDILPHIKSLPYYSNFMPFIKYSCIIKDKDFEMYKKIKNNIIFDSYAYNRSSAILTDNEIKSIDELNFKLSDDLPTNFIQINGAINTMKKRYEDENKDDIDFLFGVFICNVKMSCIDESARFCSRLIEGISYECTKCHTLKMYERPRNYMSRTKRREYEKTHIDPEYEKHNICKRCWSDYKKELIL